MPKTENLFKYQVTGFWPFPLDMLRYDKARASDPSHQHLIDLGTKDHIDVGENDGQFRIILLSVNRPSHKRWSSFGWEVEGTVEEVAVERPYTDEEKLALLAEAARLRKESDGMVTEWKEAGDKLSEARGRANDALRAVRAAEQDVDQYSAQVEVLAEMMKEAEDKITGILRSVTE